MLGAKNRVPETTNPEEAILVVNSMVPNISQENEPQVVLLDNLTYQVMIIPCLVNLFSSSNFSKASILRNLFFLKMQIFPKSKSSNERTANTADLVTPLYVKSQTV